MVTKAFNPDKDIPDLFGKVIFITGGTAGLGRNSALALAKHNPSHIYISGRNANAGASIIQEIKTLSPGIGATFIQCDLASLSSIQSAVGQFNESSPRLDILMCNAGVIAVPPGLTKDGYEVQFGTNHIGHALLVKLLLPTLLRTADEIPNTSVRIIIITSIGMKMHSKEGIKFDKLHTTQESMFGHWSRYSQSKLANVLYAAELARRYPHITSASIHPGVVNTGLVSGLGFCDRALVQVMNINNMVSPEQGTHNQLWAATARKEDVVNGAFYEPVGVLGGHTKLSNDDELAKKLWEWTEKELEGYDP